MPVACQKRPPQSWPATCPSARVANQNFHFLNFVGATLLEDMPPEALILETPSPKPERSRPTLIAAIESDVPEPLRKFVGPRLKDVNWRRVAPGIRQYPIPLSDHSKASLRLIKVAPGLALPDHGHWGSQITLVLQGAFTDAFGSYGKGDVVEVGEGVEHAPIVAEGTECICLIASEGPMRFHGQLARIAQRLTSF